MTTDNKIGRDLPNADICIVPSVDDSQSQIIRKVRAQTIFDGMARELTPYVTEALALLNPDKHDIYPDLRIRVTGSLGIGTNLNIIDLEHEPAWGFNRQVDYLIGVLQSGLFCIEPKIIKELTLTAMREALHDSKDLLTERYTLLVALLCNNTPFQINSSCIDLIKQIVPEELAYDIDHPTTNSDQRRLFKLARILFLIEAYHFDITELSISKVAAKFNTYFADTICTILESHGKPRTFIPKDKAEESNFFVALNRIIDETIIEPSFLGMVRRFLPKASQLINFRSVPTTKDNDKIPDTSSWIEDKRQQAILQQINLELSAGAHSLVGGRDYPRFRFPESIMKRAALGLIDIVIVDGTRAEAESVVLKNFLNSATRILAFDVCGQYGDFTKTLYKYETDAGSKKMLFCIAQRGEDRVLSNAAALLLYTPKKDTDGNTLSSITRMPLDSLHLFYRKEPLNKEIGSEIDTLLIESAKVHAGFLDKIIKTIAMPATSAGTILKGLEEEGFILSRCELDFPTLGKTFIAILPTIDSQNLIQVIIPAVGGAGLYGDTAGIFVEEYLKRANNKNLLKLSKEIKFFATAGAITSEFYNFEEGELVAPMGEFIDYNRTCRIGIPIGTLLTKGVKRYQDHAWAPCPAVETDQGLHQLLSDRSVKVGMIDVEGLPIASAIERYNMQHPQDPASFIPIYCVSDAIDPKRTIPTHGHDFNSYAYGCRIGMALHLSSEQLKFIAEYLGD